MGKYRDLVTGTVYVKNTERALVPAGADGPLGDSLIVSGLVYKEADSTKEPIGVFDLQAVTTSVGEDRERRDVSIEILFEKKYSKKSWISKLEPRFRMKRQVDSINVTGVENYPLGGGIPDKPLTLGAASGTGQFVGAEGIVSIGYDPDTALFAFSFTLY